MSKMRDNSKYRLFCFDVDDTLVATFQHATSILYPLLARSIGCPPPPEDRIIATWGQPLDAALGTLFSPHPACPVPRLVSELQSLHKTHPVPVMPEARRILDILKRHGRRVAICSNGDPRIVRSAISSVLGLTEATFDEEIKRACDALYVFAERGQPQDEPDVLQCILDEVESRCGERIVPSETLVIGDDICNATLAFNGGADFAAITSGVQTRANLLAEGVSEDCIFSSLKDAFALTEDLGVVAIIRDSKERFLLIQEGREDSPFYGEWSGPHGRCKKKDILEEETVVRETREEVGIDVRPLRRLYVRDADTKVSDVAFWTAEQLRPDQAPRIESQREVSAIGWFSLEEILEPEFRLRGGNRDFFERIYRDGYQATAS